MLFLKKKILRFFKDARLLEENERCYDVVKSVNPLIVAFFIECLMCVIYVIVDDIYQKISLAY